MYAVFWVTTQYHPGNPHWVTNFDSLSLCCTKLTLDGDINGPQTSATLTTQRNVVENPESLQFLLWCVFIVSENLYIALVKKEVGFIIFQLK